MSARFRIYGGAALVLALAACGESNAPLPAITAADVDGAAIIAADRRPDIWISHGRTYSEQRYSPLKLIDATNVKDLGLAWEVKLTPPLSTTTTAAGLTFVSEVDKHTLHAFDSATGKEAWHFIAGGRVDSPPTYWNGRVFFGLKSARGTK